MPLKTLLLNPPSFKNFDGGASSRWPATREIESYWYPVWLTYPAGLLEGSRVLDAPPHHVSADETINICKDFEFLVLFTSTVGWAGDQRLAEAIKAANPSIRIAFVGPPVTTEEIFNRPHAGGTGGDEFLLLGFISDSCRNARESARRLAAWRLPLTHV